MEINSTKENVISEKKPVLYIVVPCYNEEKVLPETAPQILGKLNEIIAQNKISDLSRILFVNDGSKDNTWEYICELAQRDVHYIGISQSRNRGHQNALLAGLMEAKEVCDAAISIDADGQDDINVISEMIDEYLNGAEVVYGVRNSRKTDSFFKRFTAEIYYKLLNKLGAEIVYNHADYRLISSRVLEAFTSFREVNIFLRGLIPLVGFKSSVVYYERKKRCAGESHYPLAMMLNFALDGITSLSVKPINFITGLGLIVSVFGFVALVWTIVELLRHNTVQGWASIMCVVCFLGGIQLVSLGIIGQYIGKIYLETKQRPRYIISDRTQNPYKREYHG